MKYTFAALAVSAAAAFVSAERGEAATYHLTATGSLNPPPAALTSGSTLASDQTVIAEIIFDAPTPGASAGPSSFAYLNAISSFALTVGDYSFTAGNGSFLVVDDDVPNSDHVSTYSSGPITGSIGAFSPTGLRLYFHGPAQTNVFSGLSIPLAAMTSSDFQTVLAQVHFFDGQQGASLSANLDSVAIEIVDQPSQVPLPAGIPLIVTALGALAWVRRTKAR